MRAVIYVRVSTDGQERDGTSLESQEAACIAFAQAAGWHVVARFRDTASGHTLDRPGMEQVRQLLRQGAVDVLLAYAVDRLSRNQNHIGVLFDEVQQAGARLECVTEKFEDTPEGRFILAARAFIAEIERAKIIERTTRGKTERARSGKLPQATGKGIYGYIYDPVTGRRQIAPEQAAVVRGMYDEFCAGGSCHGIAMTLNLRGVPTLTGRKWHPLTVRRMLSNDVYTGNTVYRRTRAVVTRDGRTGKRRRHLVERDPIEWIQVQDATPPLISATTFNSAQQILNDPERRLRGQPTQAYRLRGHVRCLACGTPMVGQALMQGRYRYYRCRRSYAGAYQDKCLSRYVPVDTLEEAVLAAILDVLADEERIFAEATRLAQTQPEAERLAEVQRELKAVEEQQRRLARLYTSGTLPEDVLSEESRRLNSQRQRLEGERRALESSTTAIHDLGGLRKRLPQLVDRVRAWVLTAEGDHYALMLRGLQVEIAASHETMHLTGVLPDLPECGHSDGDLVTIARTSA